jgi:hypothetical protein
MIRSSVCETQMAGLDVAIDGRCRPPPGTFACGYTFCQLSSTYCKIGRTRFQPDQFTCEPLPGGCGATPTARASRASRVKMCRAPARPDYAAHPLATLIDGRAPRALADRIVVVPRPSPVTRLAIRGLCFQRSRDAHARLCLPQLWIICNVPLKKPVPGRRGHDRDVQRPQCALEPTPVR